MKLDKKFIDACHRNGACTQGLSWLKEKPRKLEQLYDYNQAWFFWLVNILSKSASKAYDAAMKTAREAYKAAEKPASEAYNAAVNTAWEAYRAAEKSAWEAYKAAEKSAWEAYKAAVKTAREAYKAAVKTALINALKMDGWK
jgi:hypothetical protein